MRKLLLALIVGTAVWVASPSIAHALPPGFYTTGTVATPYYGPTGYYNPYVGNFYTPMPAVTNYSTFTSPYGWRSFSSVSAVPGPFGYNTVYNTGTFVRPYVVGPMHSVYWNPYLNTYQYGTGALNTPVYTNSFFYGY
jgi:hypothetical protein